MKPLGIGLFGTEPVEKTVELVRLAEDLGFESAWIGDSQNIWRELYVTLGAAAPATRSIGIGSGVTNPVTRHISVTASAWATLAELAPGRTTVVVGTGDSSLKTMGEQPSSVADLEQWVERLRSLLAGEEVTDPVSGSAYSLRFPPPESIPIYVAAASPRALRMAGRVADGVVACVGIDDALVAAAMDHLATGAREAGRRLEDVRIVLWSAVAIEDDGLAARDLVRSFVASVVIPRRVGRLEPTELELVERIRERYAYGAHMRTDAEHRKLVPDSLVRRFAVAGTVEECAEQLAAIPGDSIGQLAVVPFTAPGGDRGSVMRRLREEVLR